MRIALQTATILAWSVALDALAYRFPSFRRLLKPTKRRIIQDGQVSKRVLRREFTTRTELEAQLRLQGIEHVEDVRAAYLVHNGMISTFRKGSGDTRPASEAPAH